VSYPGLSILIPAAGASRRLGQPKQLVRYKGKTLIQQTVECAQSLSPAEIIVVTGAGETPIKETLRKYPVRWISNPQWAMGMGHSIAIGARAVDTASAGLMILLCDQWRIRPHDLRGLANTWQPDRERIVCARVQDRCCPPVIFPSACFEALGSLEGDRGAQGVLAANPKLLVHVPMANAAFDLDTPAHLDELDRA